MINVSNYSFIIFLFSIFNSKKMEIKQTYQKHNHYLIVYDIETKYSHPFKEYAYRILISLNKMDSFLISESPNLNKNTINHHILLKIKVIFY